ncbi:MAG: hypothetical protein AB1413_08180 [Thermodesulfobacteriota bacterium]
MVAALFLVALGSRPVMAAEPKAGDEQPSLEMLEFLGEWQTREGVWFDPTEKEEKRVSTQEPSHEQTRNRK